MVLLVLKSLIFSFFEFCQCRNEIMVNVVGKRQSLFRLISSLRNVALTQTLLSVRLRCHLSKFQRASGGYSSRLNDPSNRDDS